jgi:hypothetical protein
MVVHFAEFPFDFLFQWTLIKSFKIIVYNRSRAFGFLFLFSMTTHAFQLSGGPSKDYDKRHAGTKRRRVRVVQLIKTCTQSFACQLPKLGVTGRVVTQPLPSLPIRCIPRAHNPYWMTLKNAS